MLYPPFYPLSQSHVVAKPHPDPATCPDTRPDTRQTRLWLDLGNTRLKYWLTDGEGQLLDHAAEQHLQAPAELLRGLIYRFERLNPDFIGVSSVLGETVNAQVAESLARLNKPFNFAQVQAQHALMTSHYAANQLGVDRWLQMLGAVEAQQQQCVIGCGTALTIDLIDHGTHLGGYIFPSIHLQRQALASGTRQIGQLEGGFDAITLGTTTQQAVAHGILLSVIGAIRQVIDQHPSYAVVMTGGDAALFAQHLPHEVTLCPDLLLTGLQRLFG